MHEFAVEELDCACTETRPQLDRHLWDELEWRLRARSSRPKSAPDHTNAQKRIVKYLTQ